MAVIPFITGVTVVDIVLAITFLNLLFTFRDYRRRRGFPYPPGPKPWPIIGNLLDSPKQSQWTTYTEMSKKHGLCDVVAKWCTSFAETSFHISRRNFVPSSIRAGNRGALFLLRDQRPTRKTGGNLLRSSYFADASYVSIVFGHVTRPCCRFGYPPDTV